MEREGFSVQQVLKFIVKLILPLAIFGSTLLFNSRADRRLGSAQNLERDISNKQFQMELIQSLSSENYHERRMAYLFLFEQTTTPEFMKLLDYNDDPALIDTLSAILLKDNLDETIQSIIDKSLYSRLLPLMNSLVNVEWEHFNKNTYKTVGFYTSPSRILVPDWREEEVQKWYIKSIKTSSHEILKESHYPLPKDASGFVRIESDGFENTSPLNLSEADISIGQTILTIVENGSEKAVISGKIADVKENLFYYSFNDSSFNLLATPEKRFGTPIFNTYLRVIGYHMGQSSASHSTEMIGVAIDN